MVCWKTGVDLEGTLGKLEDRVDLEGTHDKMEDRSGSRGYPW